MDKKPGHSRRPKAPAPLPPPQSIPPGAYSQAFESRHFHMELTPEIRKAHEKIEKLQMEKQVLGQQLKEARNQKLMSAPKMKKVEAEPPKSSTMSLTSLSKQLFGGKPKETVCEITKRLEQEQREKEMWKGRAMTCKEKVENLTKDLDLERKNARNEKEEAKSLRSKLNLEVRKNERLRSFFFNGWSGRKLDLDGFLREVDDAAKEMGLDFDEELLKGKPAYRDHKDPKKKMEYEIQKKTSEKLEFILSAVQSYCTYDGDDEGREQPHKREGKGHGHQSKSASKENREPPQQRSTSKYGNWGGNQQNSSKPSSSSNEKCKRSQEGLDEWERLEEEDRKRGKAKQSKSGSSNSKPTIDIDDSDLWE